MSALDLHLKVVVASLPYLIRIAGESCLESGILLAVKLVVIQIHARIVQKVSLGDRDLLSVRAVDQQRKECHEGWIPLRKRSI